MTQMTLDERRLLRAIGNALYFSSVRWHGHSSHSAELWSALEALPIIDLPTSQIREDVPVDPVAPPIGAATHELWKTNHGMGGPWDSSTTLHAYFTSEENAKAWLTAKGYTHQVGGSTKWWWHHEECYRHTMGAISFEIRPIKNIVPIDPAN